MQVAWTITNPGRRFKGCPIFDEDAKCHFYGFLDDELPSKYYNELFFKIHEENKMLKKNLAKNMGKNMAKNMIKPNNDEGGILKMGELKVNDPWDEPAFLTEFLEEKSGNYFQGLYYQVPNHDLERGLVRVSNDSLLSYMFDVEEIFDRLNFYLDHLDMELSELSQAITDEMDACVYEKIVPPKKRYCNDFSMDEMFDWAEIEVEQHGGSSQCQKKPDGVESSTSNVDKGIDATEGVEARTSTTDKGKEKVSQHATEVVEARRSTVESDSKSELTISPNVEVLFDLLNVDVLDGGYLDLTLSSPMLKI
ncbi:hypothetical protein Tco_0418517 [Tanacetum coccineum]